MTVTSDYIFNNISNGCGGTGDLLVTYTIKDDCGNAITRTATITISDTGEPELSCAPLDEIVECLGTIQNQQAADQWNQENIDRLRNCATDGCTTTPLTVTSDYIFNNISNGCGGTGDLLVTYTIKDDCGNAITRTATITISDTGEPELSCAPLDEIVECLGADPKPASRRPMEPGKHRPSAELCYRWMYYNTFDSYE